MRVQMRQESLAAARTLRACKLCTELQGAAKEFEAVDGRIRLVLLFKKKKKKPDSGSSVENGLEKSRAAHRDSGNSPEGRAAGRGTRSVDPRRRGAAPEAWSMTGNRPRQRRGAEEEVPASSYHTSRRHTSKMEVWWGRRAAAKGV